MDPPRGIAPDWIASVSSVALLWTVQHEDHADPWHVEQLCSRMGSTSAHPVLP
jgi:hypothetical protein